MKTGRGEITIEIHPGQFVFGRHTASKELGMVESTVWKRMNKLKNTQNLNIESNSQYSIISIINWGIYQQDNNNSDSKSNRQVTGKEQASNTNKNDKNDKNEKNKEKGRNFIPPLLDDVILYFKEKGYSTEVAKRAFEYYSTADWKDSRGKQVRNWKQKMLAVWFKEENKEKTDERTEFLRRHGAVE